MPGPCMLHATREDVDYEFFARKLSYYIKGKPIKIWGSDGEKAIKIGIPKGDSFNKSVHLVCMLHARANCENKLVKSGLPVKARNKILNTMYGKEVVVAGVRTRTAGLVDCESSNDFDLKCREVSSLWKQIEIDHNVSPSFGHKVIKQASVKCPCCP